jgi:ribosomal protein S12 methylthiotransferase
MKKVHITSLGCAKNLVDSDVLGGQLKHRNYDLVDNPENADVIIVNTCGFIEDAKSESIQAIFEAVDITRNSEKKLYVTGCLSQRYKNELRAKIPEVDAIFGTEDYENILKSLGEEDFHPENMYKMRDLTTPGHFAYIKISEGCDHICAFCAIPGIRGKHRSRTVESILEEAETLAAKGVKELLLVSQDTSAYGRDIYDRPKTVDLIKNLADENMFEWIRPLYWYPTNFPLKFIELMNEYETIVPYLDMPIQHASDNVLRNMRRGETKRSLNELYKNIKSIRPDITLRTTLILGHPGETEQDFEYLKQFISEIRFDRIGSFIYSDEEGTTAFDLTDKVDHKAAVRRRDEIMNLQQKISTEKNKILIGTRQKVIIDAYDSKQKVYHARTSRDAPEIDNEVIINIEEPDPDLIGTMNMVEITDAAEYDLYAQLEKKEGIDS